MEKTLVVMAAGMGSRFGGLKQIEPVGPNGEFIIDYSIYDAVRCGFEKVVFIIKEENLEVFKETIGKRVDKHIKVCYAFQKLEDVPIDVDFKERKKPLGTAHALYAAREYINGNFAVINADDYYGYNSFKIVSEFLDKKFDDDIEHYSLIGYKVKNTITENGSVKRGICNIENNKLVSLDESKIEITDNGYLATSLGTLNERYVDGDALVSMNLFGFTKNFIKSISEGLEKFLKENENNIETCEYLIPDVITKQISNKEAEVLILETSDKWYGITYKEDKEYVVKAIEKMIQEGIYKEKLWN